MKGFINERIKEFLSETGYYDGIIEMGMVKIEDLLESVDESRKMVVGSWIIREVYYII